jgi:hypothetical protein
MRSLLLVVVLTTTAHADWKSKQDGVDAAPRGTVLPVDAIASAKQGDWTILEGETRIANKLVPDRIVIRIGAPLEPKTTQVVWFRGEAGGEAPFMAYVAGKHPIRVGVLGYASTYVRGFKTSAAKCKLATEVACTKVAFHHDGPAGKHEVVIEMAPRVRGSGIVSLEVKDDHGVLWKLRTVGYGRGKTVEWGTAAPGDNLADPSHAFANARDLEKRRNLVGLLYKGGGGFFIYTFPDFEVPVATGMRGRTANDPTVVVGKPAVKGELDPEIVRRYIKRNLARFRYCYEKQLLVNPTLAGVIDTTFEIGGDGYVTSVTASGVDLDVSKCYQSAIKGIQFPKPKNEQPVTVTYPFTLSS